MPPLEADGERRCSDADGAKHARLAATAVTILILALGAVLFAPVLSAERTFGFRDAAHYYYPLLKHCGRMWASLQPPLWNPFADLGRPLAADPTASVFYPLKLLFAAPLPYPLLYNIYIIAHWGLALWGMYALARCCGASRMAATAAALGYACSGSVLFNVYNLIYLVGAAWLPLALVAAERLVRTRTLASALMLGAAWAMIVLGGDMQAAYHGLLLAAAWIGLRLLLRRRDAQEEPPEGAQPADRRTEEPASADASRPRSSVALVALLTLAAAIGAGLSAVQWLPSLEAAAHSTRARWTYAERLTGRTSPDSHSDDVYQFSVGPWRWAEFLLPNVYGRQFPVHHRWIDALPAEGRVWTPSLYFGLPGLLAAAAALGARRLGRRWGAAEWFGVSAAAVGLLGACGWFGPVWFAQQCGLGNELAPPLGGVYWLLSLLPGYGCFRYPAKLLTVAALGLSLLSARGFDDWLSGRRIVGRWPLALLAGIAVAGAVAWWITHEWFVSAAAAVPADPVFGPFDAAGAWRDTLAAFVHLALAAIALLLILPRQTAPAAEGEAAPPQASNNSACCALTWRACLLVALTAVDLAVAQRWMIASVPVGLIEPVPKREDSGVPPRVAAPDSYLDPCWREQSSADRLAEVARRDGELLRPNLNLTARVAVISGQGALVCADFADELRRLGPGAFAAEGWTAATRAWLVERPDQVDAARPSGVESLGRAHVWQYGPHQVVVAVESQAPAWLVVAEQYYPGWRAYRQSVDKTQLHPLPVERVGAIFRGVHLPSAGKQTIVFRYQPLLWPIAAGVSIGTALLLLAASAVIYRRSRGKR